jgi:hypothetical protein
MLCSLRKWLILNLSLVILTFFGGKYLDYIILISIHVLELTESNTLPRSTLLHRTRIEIRWCRSNTSLFISEEFRIFLLVFFFNVWERKFVGLFADVLGWFEVTIVATF